MKKKSLMWYSIAFLIPFVVSIILCIAQGVYPFGDRCILHVDMYHQYCPFFTEFMDKLKNGKSLLYSFHQGLGADFVALYAYYLSSPLNLLLLFWPKGYVIEFMTLLIWLKLGLSGMFFFSFLCGHFSLNNQNYSKDNVIHKLLPAIVFSSAYAMSGYMTAYSWNIMWLDGVMLAPLCVLGVERIVKGKAAVLYYASLALAIFSNYYIAIMLCIFLAGYFFLYAFAESHRLTAKVLLRFGGYSLLAGTTSAILILPEIAILGYSGSSGMSFPKKVEWYFGFFEEIVRCCTTSETYTGSKYWPNLYAGAFCLLLFFLFLFNHSIRLRKRIVGFLAIAFFFLSFSNNVLDFIWHGFHFPDSLPARQSFLYILLILLLSFEVVNEWKSIKLWHVFLSGCICAVLLVIGAFATDESVTSKDSVWITLLFMASYICLFVLTKAADPRNRAYYKKLLLVVALGEVIIHMAATGYYTTSRTSYLKNQKDYALLLERAKEIENGQFYRVEDIERLTKNDDMRYGYASATQFSSLMNINVSHLFQDMYMEGGKNFYCYNGSIPLTSAMLSVKYILSNNSNLESPYRRLVDHAGEGYLYENAYCLPLGYVISEAMSDNWKEDRTDRFSSLNDLGFALGASRPMLENAIFEQQVEAGKTTITVQEDGYYYISYTKCDADTLTATSTNHGKRKFSKTTHKYLMELGQLQAAEEVSITNSKKEEISFYVYRLNKEAMDEAYQTLTKSTMEVTSHTDTKITGTILAIEPGLFVLSIPSDTGWSIWIDGEKKEVTPFKEALLATTIKEGKHEIVLRYETPGLKLGGMISILSVFIAVLALWCFRPKFDRTQNIK